MKPSRTDSPTTHSGERAGCGRILIVDDEEIIHRTLKRVLGAEDYCIDSAYSGREALDALSAGYDIVILDIRMPQMSGIEILREIRKRQLEIEVLVLTGYASMESAAQAKHYGARGYILKPIEDIEGLKRDVREAVRMSQLARENMRMYEAIMTGQGDVLSPVGASTRAPAIRDEIRDVFRRFMEVTRDAIVILDYDGNIVLANPNCAKMLGESYATLLGKQFELYTAEEDRSTVIEVLTRLSQGEIAMSISARLISRGGSCRSVVISGSPFYHDIEYRGVMLVISDVTEIEMVKGKVEVLARLVETAPYDMIFLLGPGGRVVECNQAATTGLGYPRVELLSLNMEALFRPGDGGDWAHVVKAVEKESQWRGELTAVTKDGHEFPVETCASKSSGLAAQSLHMMCIVRNLSERKRAEATQAEARAKAARVEELEREVRSLERLAAPPDTAITARTFGLVPLREAAPGAFDELLQRYGDLLEIALEQRAFKVEHDVSGELRALAERMGLLHAGPRDAVEIHSTALRAKTREANHAKAKAYAEEGRMMVLELMGHLASFYRSDSLGLSRPSPPASARVENSVSPAKDKES